MMKNIFPIILLTFTMMGCNSNEKKIEELTESTKTKPTHNNEVKSITYRLVFDESKQWGYQIFEGSKMLINQLHIPAIQGNIGFSTKEKAEITAQYVVAQMKKGVFPPTLSRHVLDSLKVIDSALNK